MTPYGVRVALADAGSTRARRAGPPPAPRRDLHAELDAERVRLRAWRANLARAAKLLRIAQEMELDRLRAPSTMTGAIIVYVSGTATASSFIRQLSGGTISASNLPA